MIKKYELYQCRFCIHMPVNITFKNFVTLVIKTNHPTIGLGYELMAIPSAVEKESKKVELGNTKLITLLYSNVEVPDADAYSW